MSTNMHISGSRFKNLHSMTCLVKFLNNLYASLVLLNWSLILSVYYLNKSLASGLLINLELIFFISLMYVSMSPTFFLILA